MVEIFEVIVVVLLLMANANLCLILRNQARIAKQKGHELFYALESLGCTVSSIVVIVAAFTYGR